MTILESRRLRLRAVEPEDAGAMMAVENDTECWYCSDTLAPYSMHTLREYALTAGSDPFAEGQLRLIAEERISGEIAGVADFYELSALHRRAFVAVYVMPEKRRKRYGEEMLRLMGIYGRGMLMLENLAARVPADNAASMALFMLAGYRHAGTLLGWHRSCGSAHDVALFQLAL